MLGAVTVTTDADIVEHRRLTAIRAAMLGVGLLLAVVLGAGWIVVSILAVVHFLLFRTRTALVAVIDGLAVVRLSALTVNLTRRWPVGEEVTVTPQPGSLDRIHLASWTGMISTSEAERLETVVGRGGGSLVRT